MMAVCPKSIQTVWNFVLCADFEWFLWAANAVCSRDRQQIAEYPHILCYIPLWHSVRGTYWIGRWPYVCAASIEHPPHASHRWLCHFVTEPSVSFVVTPTIVPFHFVCVRVYGWLRIKSQSTPKQSKSLPEWENTRTPNENGRTALK